MALHKLVFDTTNASTIADSASVGAYLRASDGTLLTHTDVGGKKSLDVRVSEGINVEIDLSHVDDSVKVGDGTDFLEVNADGSINITDNGGSLTVDATDLDIRDLTHVSDSMKIGDGTDFLAIDASGRIGVTQGTSPWVVSATDLDIRDLAAATDSVSSWTKDGSGTSISSTSNALHVHIASTAAGSDPALANTAIAAFASSASGTAADLVASPLSSRKYLFAYNNGNRTVFIGGAGVTAAAGFPIPPGGMLEMRAGSAVDIEAITSGTTQEMRTLELS